MERAAGPRGRASVSAAACRPPEPAARAEASCAARPRRVDVVLDQVGVEVFDLSLVSDLFETGDDLVVGEKALLLTVGDELLELFDLRERRDFDGEQVGDLRLVVSTRQSDERTSQCCAGTLVPALPQAARILVSRSRVRKESSHVTKCDDEFADPLAATVARSGPLQARQIDAKGTRNAASAELERADEPTSRLRATPMPLGPAAQNRPSAPPLANQPAPRIRWKSAPSGPPTRPGARASRRRCDGPPERLEARVGEGHALERKGKGDDSASVDCRRRLVRVGVGGLGMGGEADCCTGWPALRKPWESQWWPGRGRASPACLPEQLLRSARGTAGLRAELEVVLGGRRLGEQRADGRDRSSVARCDAEAIAMSRSSRSGRGADERQRLDRLRRRTEVRDEPARRPPRRRPPRRARQQRALDAAPRRSRCAAPRRRSHPPRQRTRPALDRAPLYPRCQARAGTAKTLATS